MKAIITCLIMVGSFLAAYSSNTDSATYNLQRQKINSLLADRAQKFNQYTESLDTKTGIFGWQTKKDIRRSGEILMDIAHTDETIFKEIKILLDFNTFQTTQVVAQSHDNEDRSYNYMLTINKLRKQNDVLLEEQSHMNEAHHQRQTIFIIVIILLIATSIFLFFRRSGVNRA